MLNVVANSPAESKPQEKNSLCLCAQVADEAGNALVGNEKWRICVSCDHFQNDTVQRKDGEIRW